MKYLIANTGNDADNISRACIQGLHDLRQQQNYEYEIGHRLFLLHFSVSIADLIKNTKQSRGVLT